jgi:hypothetical protein
MRMQTFQKTTLVSWVLGWSWWFVYFPFAAFEMRLAWEETWLTWTQGEQMIGFTLMHVYGGFFLVGVLGALGTALWVFVAATLLLLRRNKLLMTGKVQFGLATGTLVLALLPIDRWVLRLR